MWNCDDSGQNYFDVTSNKVPELEHKTVSKSDPLPIHSSKNIIDNR